jgi:hypothetical protein
MPAFDGSIGSVKDIKRFHSLGGELGRFENWFNVVLDEPYEGHRAVWSHEGKVTRIYKENVVRGRWQRSRFKIGDKVIFLVRHPDLQGLTGTVDEVKGEGIFTVRVRIAGAEGSTTFIWVDPKTLRKVQENVVRGPWKRRPWKGEQEKAYEGPYNYSAEIEIGGGSDVYSFLAADWDDAKEIARSIRDEEKTRRGVSEGRVIEVWADPTYKDNVVRAGRGYEWRDKPDFKFKVGQRVILIDPSEPFNGVQGIVQDRYVDDGKIKQYEIKFDSPVMEVWALTEGALQSMDEVLAYQNEIRKWKPGWIVFKHGTGEYARIADKPWLRQTLHSGYGFTKTAVYVPVVIQEGAEYDNLDSLSFISGRTDVPFPKYALYFVVDIHRSVLAVDRIRNQWVYTIQPDGKKYAEADLDRLLAGQKPAKIFAIGDTVRVKPGVSEPHLWRGAGHIVKYDAITKDYTVNFPDDVFAAFKAGEIELWDPPYKDNAVRGMWRRSRKFKIGDRVKVQPGWMRPVAEQLVGMIEDVNDLHTLYIVLLDKPLGRERYVLAPDYALTLLPPERYTDNAVRGRREWRKEFKVGQRVQVTLPPGVVGPSEIRTAAWTGTGTVGGILKPGQVIGSDAYWYGVKLDGVAVQGDMHSPPYYMPARWLKALPEKHKANAVRGRWKRGFVVGDRVKFRVEGVLCGRVGKVSWAGKSASYPYEPLYIVELPGYSRAMYLVESELERL